MSPNTDNFGIHLPSYGERPWDTTLFNAFNMIDNMLADEHKDEGGKLTHGEITADSLSLRNDEPIDKNGRTCLMLYLADKENDGTYQPYSSTSWDFNTAKNPTGSATITWATDFSVPSTARALLLRVSSKTSTTTPTQRGYVRISTVETSPPFYHVYHMHNPITVGSDNTQYSVWVMPVPASGKAYVTWQSDEPTANIYIRIVVVGVFL